MMYIESNYMGNFSMHFCILHKLSNDKLFFLNFIQESFSKFMFFEENVGTYMYMEVHVRVILQIN